MIQSRRKYAIMIDCSALAGVIILHMLAIASNLVITSLVTNRGRVLGTFSPFDKVFSVTQSDFVDLEGSPCFLPRHIK